MVVSSPPFHVLRTYSRTQCTTESSSVDSDGWRVTRARWHFKLRWVPGGENTRRIQPERPWWQPQVQPTGVELSPYVILPPQLRTDFDRTADEIASEVTTRKGWHCTQCGRLNVQRLLCYQECVTPGCKVRGSCACVWARLMCVCGAA